MFCFEPHTYYRYFATSSLKTSFTNIRGKLTEIKSKYTRCPAITLPINPAPPVPHNNSIVDNF